MLNKKASLEISIQAIVIVVLAMTLLGLGLGFIRGQFKAIGETAGTVQEQVREQITELLRESDRKLAFPTNEVAIQKKDSTILAVGIKNTKSSASKFSINIKKIDTDDGRRSLPDEGVDGKFIYNKGLQPLGVNDPRVIPIKYIASVSTGTKTFELVVCDCGDAQESCSSDGAVACAGGADVTEYDSKTFFITIT